MDPLVAVAVLGASLLHASWHALVKSTGDRVIALARLYDREDLGRAYPLARGFAPVMATALAYGLLGETPSAAAIAGVLLICAGLMLLAVEAGGRGTPAARWRADSSA